MKKLIFSLLVGMLCAVSATEAAERGKNVSESYLFIGVQGGAQTTLTNYDNSKLVMPFGAVYVGGYYNPVVGGRFHVSGWRSKGNVAAKNYYYNYYTANADMLLNLSNLLWKKDSHFLNLVLLGGVGLNYAWHNNDFNNILNANPALIGQNPTAWSSSNLGHNFRLGLQLDMRVSKRLGVNLELDANNMSDKFNSKYANDDDWMLTASVGLSYKFAFKSKNVKSVPAPAPVAKPVPAVKPAPKPAPEKVTPPAPAPAAKPAPAPAPKTITENIFYSIRSSQITTAERAKVEKVVAFMKENPSAEVHITGYADAKTGNSKVNMAYSQQRAKNLKDFMVSKYGVDAGKITVEAKGDAVQPFSENEKNRVSIVVGTTK